MGTARGGGGGVRGVNRHDPAPDEAGRAGDTSDATPQGFKWLARPPDIIERPATDTAQDAPGSPRTNDRAEQGAIRDVLLETLQHELALRNREITRLHEVVAYQAQAIERATAALPAGPDVSVSPPPPADPPARRGFWAWLLGREG